MAATELSEHVEELARELSILVIPPWAAELPEGAEPPTGAAGEMRTEDGQGIAVIWVSEEPTTAEPYLLALHELGHHVVTTPVCCGGGYPDGVTLTACESCPDLADGGNEPLRAEIAAWAWAEEHSRIPITPRLRAFIERRLDSYRG